MSFIRITTYHPDGRRVTGVTQQVHISAQEAFDRRLARVKSTRQEYTVEKPFLTLWLHPTDVIDYSQRIEYSESLLGLDDNQPTLPMEAK